MLEIKVKAENLEIYESAEFEGEMAFEFEGEEYLLGDFTHTTENEGWSGVMGLNYFAAYFVRVEDGTVTLGYAHW